jgi:hypothetical protein
MAAMAVLALGSQIGAQTPLLTASKFHNLQLNSIDPDAAIAFYMKELPSTSKTTWEGTPALSSSDNVLIVFNKVVACMAARVHSWTKPRRKTCGPAIRVANVFTSTKYPLSGSRFSVSNNASSFDGPLLPILDLVHAN